MTSRTAPPDCPGDAGEGTLISSGITGVVSAYTRRPGEGLGIGPGYYVVLSRILHMDFAEYPFHALG